jgi:methyl-accepting chemotaxis protein
MAVNDQTKGVEGEYVGIYASMGEATNLVRARVLNVTNVLENIAVGNTSRLEELKKIGRRSEQDRLMPAIVKAMENVSILIEDTEMLSRAAVEGKLDTRADASRHQGEYRKIVEGVNDTLDAVIGPLNVAAEYVERIGRGEIPEPITENYKGDFNEIKNNLNNCIEGLQGLVECNNILQRMAVNDQTKGVEGEYVGIYASMGEATNLVRARVLNVTKQLNNIAVGDSSELEGLKKIGKRSEQDQLLPAIIRAMENVKLLIEDTEMLSRAAIEGKLDTRADASRHQGEYRKIVEGVNDTLDSVIGPLNVAAEYVERISRGDIPKPITDNYNGDFNEIKNNLNTCITAINKLIEDSLMLADAGVAGRLDTRADANRHEGDFRRIVTGVNNTLASVIGPLNVAAEYVERISRGDIPKPITDNYNGDFNEIKNNLNTCITAVNRLIEDSLLLSEAAIEGRLDTRADATRHEGDFRKIVEGVNDTLDAVIGPLNVAAEYVERISRGDIPEPITDNYNGDFNKIKNNLNNCIEGLQGLVECNHILQRMAVNDQTKGVEGEYVGIYASMGEATNLVQSRILNVTNVLENIAIGNTSRLEELKKIGRRSEQDRLMPAIIRAMDNVNLLIEDTEMLSRAAVEGKLDTRTDASRHQGEYRKIVEGINDTLDAVIGPLNVSAEYVERISRGDIPEPITDNYNGDFNEIKNNLNTCIEAVNKLIEDSLLLSEAAVEGRLDTRADATRHEGDFRKIIEGINDTLDAVIGPLNEAIRVSNEFSNGNFRARVDEKLRIEGDFVNFKDVLNNIGISVSEIIKSSKSVTVDVAEHSNEASNGADEVARAAGEVAMSSQKSSELTRELLYKIESINREIIELSQSNEKIADTSKGILSTAHEVVNIGKDAQVLGQDTNFKMQSVEKIAKESVDRINNLTEKIKEIDSVVQLINDITSQINLLSLNAAIEAARAGEHGRGFAVVAGEVKNLASKARNATETIENVVISVQKDSKKTADAINDANKEIIDGVNSVNRTLDSLNTIIKNATQVTKDIDDIAKAIEGQTKISAKVVMASEEGNAMTREVQKESESLAAVAEETSASIEEIGAAIHEVTNLAKSLRSNMEVYSV